MQFTAPFHNDTDTIEVSSFYHQQWLVYPRYDGTTFYIRLRQHRHKVYFVDGLKHFRKDLQIFEFHQSCARPCLFSREHIWTLEITQSMLTAPKPLWNVVVLHIGMSQRYVVQPWYQFLTDSDFSHSDEVSFYYRTKDKIWEIVIRHNKNWDY
ncbi:hypothetical protein HKD37_06G016738 [Glycine soja]